ncbi:unnamed protein product [Mesocestoides corti]|uniref:Glutamyl-tRNA(Gln) amidotransferase subunit A, mitochondrial n=1 Tax=Mesocestoides corti TaxID=53468 RepID=A0A0R3UHB1_MESCO|nr:unnamed protein product [Mesocestoides corti]
MKPGAIDRLRRAMTTGNLDPGYLRRFLIKRIKADQCAAARHLFVSDLNLPTTNAVISCFTEPTSFTSSGPLAGIPFVSKDNYCVKSFEATTCASKALNNYVSPYSASVVQALFDAGAVCLGKTNMDEFAMGSGTTENALHGPVVNPWSTTPNDPRIAGGSSGGSTAAVAAGLAPFALASDTGGSVRNPAALCGVVGLKPTYGLISRHGMVPLANIFDCPSLTATRVADIQEVLAAWLRPRSAARTGDSTLAVAKPPKLCSSPRIGIPKEYYAPGMVSEVAEVWNRVASWLADDFNLSVESVSLPHTPVATAVYSVLCSVEVASNMARYDGLRYGLRVEPSQELCETLAQLNLDTLDGLMAASRQWSFNDEVRNRILAGNFFLLRGQRHKHLDAARRLWRLVKADYDQVFTQVDFLLAPINLHPAPNLHEFRQLDNRSRIAREDPCTVGVNLAGVPAIAIPIQLSCREKLPIGLQLIGPPWSESQLLTLAGRIEERADFPLLVEIPKLLGVD